MGRNFRARLRGGEMLLGTMLTLPTPAVAEMLAGLGFDWLFIDAEHGPLETAELLGLLQATSAGTAASIVRVPAGNEVAIKKVLDLGADGLIVPQVNTPEQAAAIVSYARYAPEGARGIGLARAHAYGLSFADYLARANDEIAVIAQAEHVQAVENIEAIVRVPGIDAILLGPYDLSASLGKPGQVDDPAVVEAIEHVTRTCLEADMPLGYFGVSAEAVRPCMQRGFRLIVAGVDTLMLGTAAQRLLESLKRSM
jgi:2-keto-3-deoxy-L-rhamnonate aldolase RhmA